jgi:hypothetical protein
MDAQTIYDNYILESGALCVNVSYPNRMKVKAFFEKSFAGKKKAQEMKEDSSTELISRKFSEEPLLEASFGALSTSNNMLKDPLSEVKLIFDLCQVEIFHLMARDSFMRFCRTQEFHDYWRDNLESYDSFNEN